MLQEQISLTSTSFKFIQWKNVNVSSTGFLSLDQILSLTISWSKENDKKRKL